MERQKGEKKNSENRLNDIKSDIISGKKKKKECGTMHHHYRIAVWRGESQ